MIGSSSSSVDVAKELALGETIVWRGGPDPRSAMWNSIGIVPFALIWIVIAGSGFIEAFARADHLSEVATLAFVIIGVSLLVAPVFEYFRSYGTSYAITDRRLLISKNGGRSLQSLRLDRIGQVARVEAWGRTTLRIPAVLVSGEDVERSADYIKLHGLRDGDRAFQLLTRQGEDASLPFNRP